MAKKPGGHDCGAQRPIAAVARRPDCHPFTDTLGPAGTLGDHTSVSRRSSQLGPNPSAGGVDQPHPSAATSADPTTGAAGVRRTRACRAPAATSVSMPSAVGCARCRLHRPRLSCSGCSPTSVGLGHSNPSFTMRVYQHLYAETATQATEAAAVFFPARATVVGGRAAPALRPRDP